MLNLMFATFCVHAIACAISLGFQKPHQKALKPFRPLRGNSRPHRRGNSRPQRPGNSRPQRPKARRGNSRPQRPKARSQSEPANVSCYATVPDLEQEKDIERGRERCVRECEMREIKRWSCFFLVHIHLHLADSPIPTQLHI